MRYATLADVEAGFRTLEEDEKRRCLALLEEAATIIDTCSENAAPDRKQLVSCRMVRRVLGDGAAAQLCPMGATQSWTMSGGSSGELYLSKLEKRLLGLGSRVGAHSPLEDLR